MSAGHILGIDAGERRVGIALSDETQLLARPLKVLHRGNRLAPLLDELQRLAAEYSVVQLLIGLPLHADGSEGRQARRARSFAAAASSRLGVPVVLWDERYSSLEAKALIQQRVVSLGSFRQREPLDALAAAIILQHYLDTQRSEKSPLSSLETIASLWGNVES